MIIIDGRKIAQEILAEIKARISAQHLQMTLAAVSIGGDPALQKFVALKKKAAEQAGIIFISYALPEDVSETEAEDLIARLSQDAGVHGIFIELPVPTRFNTQRLLDAIDPGKDVDVLSKTQEDIFYSGSNSLLPPAVLALTFVLENQGVLLAGKKAAVFGQGRLIGKPISHWLESQGVGVSRIDEHTPDPGSYSRHADIIITGVGKPDLITQDLVKENAMVIDFGYGSKESRMVGDVAFDEVSQKTAFITPVPGGMGPLVIAAVLQNILALTLMQNSDSSG